MSIEQVVRVVCQAAPDSRFRAIGSSSLPAMQMPTIKPTRGYFSRLIGRLSPGISVSVDYNKLSVRSIMSLVV